MLCGTRIRLFNGTIIAWRLPFNGFLFYVLLRLNCQMKDPDQSVLWHLTRSLHCAAFLVFWPLPLMCFFKTHHRFIILWIISKYNSFFLYSSQFVGSFWHELHKFFFVEGKAKRKVFLFSKYSFCYRGIHIEKWEQSLCWNVAWMMLKRCFGSNVDQNIFNYEILFNKLKAFYTWLCTDRFISGESHSK